jgi:hypothetical protein
MDDAAKGRTRMSRCKWIVALGLLWLPLTAGAQTPASAPPPAAAARDPRWAVVISGASGGAAYAAQMATWRQTIQTALTSRFGFPPAQIVQLVDETAREAGTVATSESVRSTFTTLRGRIAKDDLVLVVLLGHGTFDGQQAKFNLVGPDLTAGDWAAMLSGLPGRLVVVNTTEASAPFLEALAARGRVVITATETAAQRYATVFPDYFAKALADAQSDLDKNGRTSIWEVFAATSTAVARHYTERAQLTTERAVLSDTGEKTGLVATAATGAGGAAARAFYLDREAGAESSDPAVRALIERRRTLEAEAEAHLQKKSGADPAAWAAEFERLMIELARVSREVRQRS